MSETAEELRDRADRINDTCDELIADGVPPEICQQVRAYAARLVFQAMELERDA